MVTKTFTYEGRRYYVRGKTEKAAVDKLIAKKMELVNESAAPKNSISVKAWTYKALDLYKINVSDRYLSEMKYRIEKNIFPIIGKTAINEVTAIQCQEIINAQHGKSISHITKMGHELFFIFDSARKNDLIIKNPAENLVLPKGTRHKRRALTEDEEHTLLKVFQMDPRFILFELMYYCGCRPSEATECTYEDVTEISGIPFLHIRGTKSECADRLVPIPEALHDRIVGTGKSGYIVTTNADYKFNYTSYARLWKYLKRQMNIEMGCRLYRNELQPPYPLAQDFIPYLLRHTYCTNLKKAGVDLRIAKSYMGHSDIRTTANIYDHCDNETLVLGAIQMGIVAPTVAKSQQMADLSHFRRRSQPIGQRFEPVTAQKLETGSNPL